MNSRYADRCCAWRRCSKNEVFVARPGAKVIRASRASSVRLAMEIASLGPIRAATPKAPILALVIHGAFYRLAGQLVLGMTAAKQ
jgi:hypothetical protein